MTYLQKRYISFSIMAIATIIIPFIQIDGNHLLLLDFNKTEFHFFTIVFSAQELYLMPFLIMLLFVGLFAITSLFGRFWCGWLCPQTILRFVFRDLIQTYLLGLRRNIDNKQKDPDMSIFSNKIKYLASIFIFFIVSSLVGSNFLLFFVPYDYFFANILDFENHKTLIFFALLFIFIINMLVVLLKENFCIYACPYARVQSILYDKHTFTAVYNHNRGGLIYQGGKEVITSKKQWESQEECITCNKCVKVCPSHIDIRKGLQIECIECLACADACDTIMEKFNKPSLIQWDSDAETHTKEKTNLLRVKSIAYMGAISFIIAMIVFMSFKKEYLQLNINRTSQLYVVKDTTIQNAYIFLFQNTTSKDHKYYFSIDSKYLKIIRPKKEFKLRAKSKIKKIVALEIDKNLIEKFKEEHKSNTAKIEIKAYVTDSKMDDKEIFVIRQSIFVVP